MVGRGRAVGVGDDAGDVLDPGEPMGPRDGQLLVMARPGRHAGEEKPADRTVFKPQREALVDLDLAGVAESADLSNLSEEVPAQVHVMNPAGVDEALVVLPGARPE